MADVAGSPSISKQLQRERQSQRGAPILCCMEVHAPRVLADLKAHLLPIALFVLLHPGRLGHSAPYWLAASNDYWLFVRI